MEQSFDDIDRYFNGELPPAEKSAFEERIVRDEAFAESVGFYLNARQTARSELHEQKRKEFGEFYKEFSGRTGLANSSSANASPLSPAAGARTISIAGKFSPWLSAAAVFIVIVLAWALFLRSPAPQRLADRYIRANLQELSVTMGGERDSIQLAIAAYNKHDYAQAEGLLLPLSLQSPPDPEVLKDLGILYLADKRYDMALAEFDSLSARIDLHANPGPFYKALTLMKRSKAGDGREARTLLQEIIDRKLPGSIEAAQWIDKF